MSVEVESTEPLPARAFRRGGRLLPLQIAQYGLLMLCGLVVARILGPAGRGQYALAISFAAVCGFVLMLSADSAAGRLLGRREATLPELVRLVSAVTLAVGSFAAIAALAIGLLVRDSLLGGASVGIVVVAAALIPFLMATQLAAALLVRIGALRAFGFIAAGGAAVQLALVVALALGTSLSTEEALAASLVGQILTAGGLMAVLARRVGGRALVPAPPRRVVSAALQSGIRLHASSIAVFLNLKVDLLLVGLLSGERQAGFYSLSVLLAEGTFVVLATMAVGAYEDQTKAVEAKATSYTVDFVRQNMALAVLVCGIAAALSYPFVVIVYGDEWTSSVLPFVILAVALVGRAVDAPARTLLIRIASPLRISALSLVAVAVNIALNLALIPVLGIAGAALASVASYWLSAVFMLWLLSREAGGSVKRALSLPRRDDLVRRWARSLTERLASRPGPYAR